MTAPVKESSAEAAGAGAAIQIEEGRFARFEAIKWWRQDLLRQAKVLVIGAGALGNEVIKNLALLGVGNVVIADMDRIEKSNLCRSVLFREADEGAYKAEAAARAARALYPDLRATAMVANILAAMGLGYFRWADVVVGALDNREARVFVNSSCAQAGRPWIDGGIDVLNGIVRGFEPPGTACYECTMGQADWDLLAKRRSCALLARAAFMEGGAPTTPTTASIIGAIQAQEVVKRLHGLTTLAGKGYLFEGLNHNSYPVEYPINPNCPWHEAPAPIERCAELGSDATLAGIWARGEAVLGGTLEALDFSREIVLKLVCPQCQNTRAVHKPVDLVAAGEVPCPACGAECVPQFAHSVGKESPLLKKTVREVGLPAWDIVWARTRERAVGLELAADTPGELVHRET
jgi:molybdopterin/thiamine biosynthesis adenylyltransferase